MVASSRFQLTEVQEITVNDKDYMILGVSRDGHSLFFVLFSAVPSGAFSRFSRGTSQQKLLKRY
jgi:hypothetical protein